MMLLIFLALMTSSILLPALISAFKILESKLKGEGNWEDYRESAHIVSEVMEAELTG